MVVFLGFYAAAELSHFVEIVPRVPVSAVKWKKFGKKGFKIWSNACILRICRARQGSVNTGTEVIGAS